VSTRAQSLSPLYTRPATLMAYACVLVAAKLALTLAAHADAPVAGPFKEGKTQGTETGGGAGGDQLDAIHASIKRRLDLSQSGDGPAWCSTVTEVMSFALKQSDRRAYQGDLVGAEIVLVRALEEIEHAITARPIAENPVARRVVTRALQVAATLSYSSSSASEPIAIQARYAILQEYVSFAIREIGNFNHFSGAGSAYGFKPAHLDEGIIRFASNQLFFLTGPKLVLRGKDTIAPAWDERAVLRVTELIVRHVSLDLLGSLQRVQYACTATRLKSLADSLQGFNLGTGYTHLDRGRDAFRESIVEVELALSEIKTKNCQ